MKKPSIDDVKFAAAIKDENIFFAAGSGNANVPPPYTFRGAFMLAPTDFGSAAGLNNVPLANLLPGCDGDVSSLDGALVYDHNRHGPQNDAAPRYQILVQGTNHNDYNTIWTGDDFNPDDGPDNCLRSATRKDSIRLSAEDQRRTGLFAIASFMRYHVGGEQKFRPYWNGIAQLPDAACPSGRGPCDERMNLTIQKQGAKIIHQFDKPDGMSVNAFGGSVTFSGFDTDGRALCAMGLNRSTAGLCSPNRLAGFQYRVKKRGLLSNSEHVELSWSNPNASIVNDLKGISAKNYNSLTFRIAVVRPMGQEVLVTLTDTSGKSATVTASDFSDALYNAPRRKIYPVKEVPVADAPIGLPDAARGIPAMVDMIGQQPTFEVPSMVSLVAQPEPDPARDIPMLDAAIDKAYAEGQAKILMNMVAIPLKAFEGVDLEHLKELKLAFPKESGKVAITDIELQNFGRAERLAEIALSQAGILGGAGGGIALGGNGGPPQSASVKPEDKQLIVNH